MVQQSYDRFLEIVRRAGTLDSVAEVLAWDQEVMMPEGGSSIRAKEQGVIEALAHEIITSDELGELLVKLESAHGLDEDQMMNVREIATIYHHKRRVPCTLVEKMANASVHSAEVWKKAREENDFGLFAPAFRQVVDLAREYARAIDPSELPSTVTFAEYEEDMTVEEVRAHFDAIKSAIVPLIERIAGKPRFDRSILRRDIPIAVQHEFNKKIAAMIGYDFGKGRLDVSTHPMTCLFGRITTRYSADWSDAIGSTIHEVGHAMYEHGLPLEHFGLPLGSPMSMTIHESQSRLWENHVGKSRAFWSHALPLVQEAYAPDLDDITLDALYEAINAVEPGFIRVEADELTYTMHIILRFELETKLMNGDIEVDDLPHLWNEKMQEYLSITPRTDSEGVLQDPHWAEGWFGYFPTYTLGTMIAAQLFEAARDSIPDLDARMRKGSFSSLKGWLHDHIYRHGQRYGSKDLIKRATGAAPGPDAYIRHLETKYRALYHLDMPLPNESGKA